MWAKLAARSALPALLLTTVSPVRGESILDRCAAETCKARLTSDQLLGEVQELVAAKRYDDVKPLLAALATVPALRFETRFLTGYVAEETGDYGRAEAMFRAILVDDPSQTRVRLELGRTLLAMGHTQSADHQLRLAAESKDLPPEIARTIRSVRNIIRTKRQWSVNVDFGIAPDTNINNATGVDTINVFLPYSPDPLAVSLSSGAKARSGVGVTGSIDGGLRLPLSKNTLMLVDVAAFATEYKHKEYDDLSMELAAGPEFKLSQKIRVRAEGVVAQRDYGNRVVSRQVGIKSGVEYTIDDKQQLGLQIDVRNTDAMFDSNYSGWQTAINATYERVIGHTLIASASAFIRRDSLVAAAYSNTELGGVLGIGGELPKGFNFGVSAGGSHASYDAPIPLFSPDPRRDWRYNLNVTLGNRAIRVWGFSPSVTFSYGRGDSSIAYYATERKRFRFALARYF
jgi:hypothetical protein